MQNRNTGWLLLTAVACVAFGPAALAHESGDKLLRVGVGTVDPKSDNGNIASVGSGTTLVFNGTYMLTPNIGIELLASSPFSHDVKLAADGTKVGEAKHLPPTLSVQYHFDTQSAFSPYVGAGLNYTLFFDEKATGPLAGMDLDLDASFGIAAQLGFDYGISDRTSLNVDVRWMDIDTDAKLDGAPLETVEIDPFVYSLALSWTF